MSDRRIAAFDAEEDRRLAAERTLGTRHEKSILCGNFDCPTRQAMQWFPVFSDGIHVWTIETGRGLDLNGKPVRVQGELVPDGQVWLCPACR